jgi:YesN/AraC family two-component response regulator
MSVETIPDLIITDLLMPEMDGLEMCEKIKTDQRTSHIPVIMLTSRTSVNNRIEGFEKGADDYISKPFNMKELLVRIKNLIEQRKMLRERFSRNVRLHPKDISITSEDEKFLSKTITIIEENLNNFDFDVSALTNNMAFSRVQLFRKLKSLTDQSPSEFIRTIRLRRAAQLLDKGFGNIAEVTYQVGFNNLSYFAKCFRELFGVSPSDYAKHRI